MELNATPSHPLSVCSKNEMSASLRERLKRCSRYGVSPSSVSKRPCNEPSPLTPLSSQKCQSQFVEQTNGRAVFQTPPSSKPSSSYEGSQAASNSGAQSHMDATTAISKEEQSPSQVVGSIALNFRKTKLEPKKLLEASVLDASSETRSDYIKIHSTTLTSELNLCSKVSTCQNFVTEPMDAKLSTDEHKNVNILSDGGELETTTESPDDRKYSESSSNNGIDNSSVNVSSFVGNCSSPDVLVRQRKELEDNIKRKEETLRKLNLVKMYRVKNDLNNLDTLTSKWKSVCQDALQELLASAPDPRPSMIQLINHLQIDPQMVNYNVEEESFA